MLRRWRPLCKLSCLEELEYCNGAFEASSIRLTRIGWSQKSSSGSQMEEYQLVRGLIESSVRRWMSGISLKFSVNQVLCLSAGGLSNTQMLQNCETCERLCKISRGNLFSKFFLVTIELDGGEILLLFKSKQQGDPFPQIYSTSPLTKPALKEAKIFSLFKILNRDEILAPPILFVFLATRHTLRAPFEMQESLNTVQTNKNLKGSLWNVQRNLRGIE